MHYGQKAYDTFAQQIPQQPPAVDGFPAQPSHQANSFSSAPSEYTSAYADQHRNNFGNYYNQGYGQTPQDGLPPAAGQQQQRPYMNYNNPSQADAMSQYPQNSRFGGPGGENQNSGHNTPTPGVQGQHQPPTSGPGSNPQSQFYNHQQQYYQNPFYPGYYPYGQGAFSGPGGYGKNSMYSGYPGAFDQHNSSSGGFGQAGHRDNGINTGSEYNRQGAGQGAPGLGGFGGNAHDSFLRGPSGYQGQTSQAYSNPAQTTVPSGADDLKTPYGEAKVGAGGPSPALSGARPGSAANNGNQGGQNGLPPQTGAGGYNNGYPHSLHNSYGATGQHSSYSSYQNNAFGYYGGGGQQQHRGGWGGNYH